MNKLTFEQINEILSDTLKKVVDKKISVKQAKVISDLAKSLSINTAKTELNRKIELLEIALKINK